MRPVAWSVLRRWWILRRGALRGLGARQQLWWRNRAWSQLTVRVGVVAGVVLCLLAAALAGTALAAWGVVLLVGVSVAASAWPDTVLGVLLLLGCAATWLPDRRLDSAWVLLGTAGLLLSHVGLQLAALAPATSRIAPRLLRLWGGRMLLAWSLGAALWAVGRLLPSGGDTTGVRILALLVVAGTAVAVSAILIARPAATAPTRTERVSRD